ncbi:MAG: ATP-binding cassette domain-containing protein, partial [Planctomycetes bacterium]|nr:ATP-binding cassette domain-containing protein [Planctomycetota bacterium]
MQPAIVCERLSRWFGARCVLRDLDLVVPVGCVYGLIGRNGAGKTSTLRMLIGLLAPSRGRAQVLG